MYGHSRTGCVRRRSFIRLFHIPVREAALYKKDLVQLLWVCWRLCSFSFSDIWKQRQTVMWEKSLLQRLDLYIYLESFIPWKIVWTCLSGILSASFHLSVIMSVWVALCQKWNSELLSALAHHHMLVHLQVVMWREESEEINGENRADCVSKYEEDGGLSSCFTVR